MPRKGQADPCRPIDGDATIERCRSPVWAILHCSFGAPRELAFLQRGRAEPNPVQSADREDSLVEILSFQSFVANTQENRQSAINTDSPKFYSVSPNYCSLTTEVGHPAPSQWWKMARTGDLHVWTASFLPIGTQGLRPLGVVSQVGAHKL